MPDIGFFELLVVGAIAFLILGPERTPEFFAQIGRMVRQGRAWISTVKQQIDAETQVLKEPMQEVRDSLSKQLDDHLDDGLSSMTSTKKSDDTKQK
ncbi:MAG: twin-arginine translocase subunit TatB [Mariprofundaceae bacterium]|nr:twin-arginine translocase subunit TatB [Mariprofundaceae bacterium]